MDRFNRDYSTIIYQVLELAADQAPFEVVRLSSVYDIRRTSPSFPRIARLAVEDCPPPAVRRYYPLRSVNHRKRFTRNKN